MKGILIITLLLLSSALEAKNLCPEVKAAGEGHMPIPESAFTEENSLAALDDLKEIIPHLGDFEYFVKNVGIDFESAIKNKLILINGYSLKVSAEQGLKFNSDSALKRFCLFIKEEAIVWH